MVYRSMFPRDLFAELDRMQRDMQQTFDSGASIRGFGRGSFPAVNTGATPQSIELFAFAPGLDPSKIDVQLERGLLTVTGERTADLPGQDQATTVHIHERFAGRFRRVVSLPDDVNPEAVTARYKDGVLHVSIARLESAQPRRITVQ